MNKNLFSIIVPCYNEEKALPYFFKEIVRVADEMSATNGLCFEILFVDDGSKDHTLQILKDYSKTDSRIQYISFSRNFGKEAAMFAGLENVSGSYPRAADIRF